MNRCRAISSHHTQGEGTATIGSAAYIRPGARSLRLGLLNCWCVMAFSRLQAQREHSDVPSDS